MKGLSPVMFEDFAKPFQVNPEEVYTCLSMFSATRMMKFILGKRNLSKI